ncbi:ArsR/SmtB family transcription factor [Streptococcus caballi]|uniref:ArsR/SmtB family transcription factor n=1 Tax=Streptococcus caballi TaxID=439220 RepID=UPI00036F396B|nr:metalloregulator ArsR/SmtB family transcription factor [Streptococcus caballi]
MIVITNFVREAQVFKALSDDKRLQILDYLKNGETCACVLIDKLGIAQSALSYHMKILCQSGIVSSRQEGKWKHYSLSTEGSQHALQLLTEVTNIQTEYISNCQCQRKSS